MKKRWILFALCALLLLPACGAQVDGETQTRIELKGELMSPIEPKPGCRFAPRCPYAKPECTQRQQELTELLPNHFVACCRAKELNADVLCAGQR